MNSEDEYLSALASGPSHAFHDWPNQKAQPISIAVYTVWDGAKFMYVGISTKSLFSRLRSHSRGVRGGDQFNIYVCDRLVLPTLSREQIEQISRRELSLDDLTRDYIQSRLTYRFVAVPDELTARSLEARIKRGESSTGNPFLNPANPGSCEEEEVEPKKELTWPQLHAVNLYIAWVDFHGVGMDLREYAEELLGMLEALGIDVKKESIDEELLVTEWNAFYKDLS